MHFENEQKGFSNINNDLFNNNYSIDSSYLISDIIPLIPLFIPNEALPRIWQISLGIIKTDSECIDDDVDDDFIF